MTIDKQRIKNIFEPTEIRKITGGYEFRSKRIEAIKILYSWDVKIKKEIDSFKLYYKHVNYFIGENINGSS
jgi:hypothetical protein